LSAWQSPPHFSGGRGETTPRFSFIFD